MRNTKEFAHTSHLSSMDVFLKKFLASFKPVFLVLASPRTLPFPLSILSSIYFQTQYKQQFSAMKRLAQEHLAAIKSDFFVGGQFLLNLNTSGGQKRDSR